MRKLFVRIGHPEDIHYRTKIPAGPYAAGRYVSIWQDGKHHPTPDEDGIYTVKPSHVFGFQSVKLMRDWFGGVGKNLSREGFKIYVYRVNVRIDGNSQAMADCAELAKVKPIAVLDPIMLDRVPVSL